MLKISYYYGMLYFVFVKQKTAYELRISDWSSDVCSSDLDVVAALLQDALVPLGDMAYLARERRFVMVANRFRWKDGADDDGLPSAPVPQRAGEDAAFAEEGAPPPFERVNSGLCFDKVRQVRYRGLRPGAKDEILCLLPTRSEALRRGNECVST